MMVNVPGVNDLTESRAIPPLLDVSVLVTDMQSKSYLSIS